MFLLLYAVNDVIVVQYCCHCLAYVISVCITVARSVVTLLIQQMIMSNWAAWLITNLKRGFCCLFPRIVIIISCHKYWLCLYDDTLCCILQNKKQNSLQKNLLLLQRVLSVCWSSSSACESARSDLSCFLLRSKQHQTFTVKRFRSCQIVLFING